MKKSAKSLLLVSAFITGSAAASGFCIPEGGYVSIGGGLSKTKSIKNSSLPITAKVGIETTEPNELGLDFKRGYNFRIAHGYKVGDVRAELELSHLRSTYKKVTGGYGSWDFNNADGTNNLPGYLRGTSALLNGYYDLPLSEILVPYVGAGVGFSRLKNHIEFTSQVNALPGGVVVSASNLTGNMTETRLMYQAIVGASINLTEQVALNADYRYLGTTKLKALDKKLYNQSLNFGLTYRF